jgi:hypothetical protein
MPYSVAVFSAINGANKTEASEVETEMTHNARHHRGADSRRFSRSVPKVRESSLRD